MVITSKEIFMAKKGRWGIPIISIVVLGHKHPMDTHSIGLNAKFVKFTLSSHFWLAYTTTSSVLLYVNHKTLKTLF